MEDVVSNDVDVLFVVSFFFINDTATTVIDTDVHTLSLHDALPIYRCLIFGHPDRPAFCAGLQASKEMCGDTREHAIRSEEQTSELQSLMRISYAVFCLKKKHIHEHIFNTTVLQKRNTSPHLPPTLILHAVHITSLI